MEKFEWERLRDGYQEQRDKAAAEGRYEDAAEFDDMLNWANDEIRAIETQTQKYTREQYEQDRAAAIASGIDPRLIMSYWECVSWDYAHAEYEDDAEVA